MAKTAFEKAIAAPLLRQRGEEAVFGCVFDKGWWTIRGPNGGVLAAMLARALTNMEGDSARGLRSLTIYYLARPEEGAAEIHLRRLRRGRRMSFYSFSMEQEGRVLAQGGAALGTGSSESIAFAHESMPEAPPPSAIAEIPRFLPIHDHYELRMAWGSYFSGEEKAETGGWFRLRDKQEAMDTAFIAAASDGWLPSVFTHFSESMRARLSAGVPTVELTIHFLASLPRAEIKADDYVLVRFAAHEAREGYFIESGEIWSSSGLLLARSRQLALV